MTMQVELDDVKLDYASIAEARKMSGLRLVLGAFTVPGPWRESCKGIFHVKGIPYTPAVSASEGRSDLEFGKDGADAELRAWTAQSSGVYHLLAAIRLLCEISFDGHRRAPMDRGRLCLTVRVIQNGKVELPNRSDAAPTLESRIRRLMRNANWWRRSPSLDAFLASNG